MTSGDPVFDDSNARSGGETVEEAGAPNGLTRRDLVVRAGGVLAAAPLFASFLTSPAGAARAVGAMRSTTRGARAGGSLLTIAITGDPTTLDPAAAADPTNTNELMCVLHDTLTRWPVVGNRLQYPNPVPNLIASYTANEGLLGVRWSWDK